MLMNWLTIFQNKLLTINNNATIYVYVAYVAMILKLKNKKSTVIVDFFVVNLVDLFCDV